MSKIAKRGSYADHVNAIRSLGLEQILFVYGTSEYLVNRTLDRVREIGARDLLAYVAVEAQSVGESLIIEIGAQGSLFDPATLYLLRRVEQARALPKLLKALPRGKLANRLVLAYRGEGAPAPLKTELTRLQAKLVPCFEPWPNEIPEVLNGMAGAFGLKLKNDAIQLLVELNGNDLVKQSHEMTKLSLVFADAKAPLGRSDVAPHLGLLREDDAFQLDRLLIARQWSKAQALSAALLARGEKGLSLLGIVAGHCRNVLKINEARALGLTPAEMASRVRMPPFILKNYLQNMPNAGRIDPKRYLDALALCQGVDVALKSSAAAEDLLIARIIDRLAAP